MPEALFANVLLFARLLRAAGLEVQGGRAADAVRALELVGVRSRGDARAALSALFVQRQEDLAPVDSAFEAVGRARQAPAGGLPLFPLGERPHVVVTPARGVPVSVDLEHPEPPEARPARLAVGAWSDAGVSRTKDFAEFTREELEQARRLLARLPWRLGARRTVFDEDPFHQAKDEMHSLVRILEAQPGWERW